MDSAQYLNHTNRLLQRRRNIPGTTGQSGAVCTCLADSCGRAHKIYTTYDDSASTRADVILTLKPKRIMFVCLGNHCRSPLAHGYFQHLVEKHGLEDDIEVASSGTSGWHLGEAPDSRVVGCKTTRCRPGSYRGQKITNADLRTSDLILVMDRSNLRDVLSLDRMAVTPRK